MSGGHFDPCECIWNHENAMRRLIQILRTSQSHCTNDQCLQEMPSLPEGPDGDFSSMMFITLGWIVIATALFLLRPASLRNTSSMKSDRRSDSPDTQPPAPTQ
ncbi:small integral membrane protein 14 [Octopus sinensis]|nr:small integral membrane protein 14-like [Octopus sinensis]XP_029640987.1 small integral membrane protein 14 [Octopus sinensis]XP_029640996.1 small integral membrane protein 14 [Octopus sinensis]XP_029641004.1 small integral membrane protein 14 [Octopus sinensis]